LFRFESDVEVLGKKSGSFQSEISRLQAEMARAKLTSGRQSCHPATERVLTQKDVVDHLKRMEALHEKVRIELSVAQVLVGPEDLI